MKSGELDLDPITTVPRSFSERLGLDVMLEGLVDSVLLSADGVLLFHGFFERVTAATGVYIRAGGAQTEVAGDSVQLIEIPGAESRITAIEIRGGVRAPDRWVRRRRRMIEMLPHPALLAESLGVQVDVFHVLRTEVVLHLHAVQRTVASRGFGVEGVDAHGAIGAVVPRPYRTNQIFRILESVGLDAGGPSLVHLARPKRSSKGKLRHYV